MFILNCLLCCLLIDLCCPCFLFLLTLILSQFSHCLSSPLPSDVAVDILPFCSPLQFVLQSNPRSVRHRHALWGGYLGVQGWGCNCGGSDFFLAQETAVNQIVRGEVFLSSYLEQISLSSLAAQKSWKGSSACLHLDRWGSVLWILLKRLQNTCR